MCRRTLSEPPKRKVSLSASWSLAGDLQSPYLGCDPRQGREVLGQAEPYRKWHSCAFRDIRCLRKPWKREHRREYMHERPAGANFLNKDSSAPWSRVADIIRLIVEETERFRREKERERERGKEERKTWREAENVVGLSRRISR